MNDINSELEEPKILNLRGNFGKIESKCFIQVHKRANGRYPDCVRRVDSKGDMILSEEDKQRINDPDYVFIPEDRVFEIHDGMTINTGDPEQKAMWECIQDAVFIAPSREAKDKNGNNLIDGTMGWDSKNPRYGVAEYYVEIPGEEAQNKVKSYQLIHEAADKILSDSIKGRKNHAKLLGKHMEGILDSEVTAYLLDVAKAKPQKIINLYNSNDTSVRLLFMEAQERHLFEYKDKMYYYGEILLGATDESVIDFLSAKEHNKIVKEIYRLCFPEYYKKEENSEDIKKPENEDDLEKSLDIQKPKKAHK